MGPETTCIGPSESSSRLRATILLIPLRPCAGPHLDDAINIAVGRGGCAAPDPGAAGERCARASSRRKKLNSSPAEALKPMPSRGWPSSGSWKGWCYPGRRRVAHGRMSPSTTKGGDRRHLNLTARNRLRNRGGSSHCGKPMRERSGFQVAHFQGGAEQSLPLSAEVSSLFIMTISGQATRGPDQ